MRFITYWCCSVIRTVPDVFGANSMACVATISAARREHVLSKVSIKLYSMCAIASFTVRFGILPSSHRYSASFLNLSCRFVTFGKGHSTGCTSLIPLTASAFDDPVGVVAELFAQSAVNRLYDGMLAYLD
jgi:hypothetical protein